MLLSAGILFAQQKEFDSIYYVTATEVIYKNPTQALKNTDYLYNIAADSSLKVRALLLKSELFRMAGLQNEAIKTLLKTDSLVNRNDSKNLLLVHGLLATNYRESNHPLAGKMHLDIARDVVNGIENHEERNKRLGNIHQEVAYILMEEQNYQGAIEEIRKSISLYKTLPDNEFGLALNEQLIGYNYQKLEVLDSAKIYFTKALKNLEKSRSPESTLKGFILNGLAKVAADKDDHENAEKYFADAEAIGEKANSTTLLKEIFEAKTAYYKKNGDAEKYIESNELYLAILKSEKDSKQKISDELISVMNEGKIVPESVPNTSKFRWEYLMFAGVLIGFSVFIYRKRRAEDQTVQVAAETEEAPVAPAQDAFKGVQKEYMSDEAMDAIVEKLQEMEKNHFFLDSNLSLSAVASEVGVNHRYLSHTVNQRFGKDFKTYINDLRIDYIIEFLKADPKHLHYKISYIAEKAGFSSHNRFSIIFKKTKGISPSELISELQEKAASEK